MYIMYNSFTEEGNSPHPGVELKDKPHPVEAAAEGDTVEEGSPHLAEDRVDTSRPAEEDKPHPAECNQGEDSSWRQSNWEGAPVGGCSGQGQDRVPYPPYSQYQ